MLAKNKATVKKHKSHARKLIKEIIIEHEFKITKRIKFGPRYFVAEGKYKGQNALFKICLYPKSYDHLTNEKFSREILFLNFIKQSKYKELKKATPYIYTSNIDTRVWYIREYLTGQTQNINEGNIRYKDAFFTTKNYNWFLKTFNQLQSIKKENLPNNFKKLLFPPQTLEYLWKFIGPFYENLDRFVKHKGATNQIHKIFQSHSKIYKASPRILAHQEVYSPHILISKKYIKLIDWENIGWALPTHDIVTIWMRAHKHPKWQAKLKNDFLNTNKKIKNIEELWHITMIMQSTFNVISYHHYFDKKDFYPLAKYSAQLIKNVVNKK